MAPKTWAERIEELAASDSGSKWFPMSNIRNAGKRASILRKKYPDLTIIVERSAIFVSVYEWETEIELVHEDKEN